MYDVVIPSFRRLEKLTKFAKSYFKSNNRNTKLYVYFDNNDSESCNEFKKRFPDVETHLLTKQHRAFRVWNLHLSTHKSDGLFYFCDDTELDSQCLQIAIKYLTSRFSDSNGLIGINQKNIMLARGGRGFCQSGMGLIGKVFADRFPNRQVFCPDYVSFRADNELGRFAERIRKFYFAKDAILTHYHPKFFANIEDETHRIVRDKQADLDRLIFTERQTKTFLWGQDFNLVRPNREKDLGWTTD